jgi:hypothetical protein
MFASCGLWWFFPLCLSVYFLYEKGFDLFSPFQLGRLSMEALGIQQSRKKEASDNKGRHWQLLTPTSMVANPQWRGDFYCYVDYWDYHYWQN